MTARTYLPNDLENIGYEIRGLRELADVERLGDLWDAPEAVATVVDNIDPIAGLVETAGQAATWLDDSATALANGVADLAGGVHRMDADELRKAIAELARLAEPLATVGVEIAA